MRLLSVTTYRVYFELQSIYVELPRGILESERPCMCGVFRGELSAGGRESRGAKDCILRTCGSSLNFLASSAPVHFRNKLYRLLLPGSYVGPAPACRRSCLRVNVEIAFCFLSHSMRTGETMPVRHLPRNNNNSARGDGRLYKGLLV